MHHHHHVTRTAGKARPSCMHRVQASAACAGKHQPADGGTGGPGGSVVLRASPTVKSLAHVRRLLAAGHGGRGGSQRRHGAVGDPRVVDVPLGTVVYRLDPEAGSNATAALVDAAAAGRSQAAEAAVAESSASAPAGLHPVPANSVGGGAASAEHATSSAAAAVSAEAPDVFHNHAAVTGFRVGTQDSSCIVADLVADGDSAVVAAGGAGGRGNVAFHRPQNRPASKRHEAGQPSELRIGHVLAICSSDFEYRVQTTMLPNAFRPGAGRHSDQSRAMQVRRCRCCSR